MVAHRERGRLIEVGISHAADGARLEKPLAPQDHIRQDRLRRHLGDFVITRHRQLASAAHRDVRDPFQLLAKLLERRLRRRRIRTALLRRIVKRRQVEVRLVDITDVRHLLEIRDALAAHFRTRERAPIAPERKLSAELREHLHHSCRLGVAAHDHPAAVLVDRRGRDDELHVLAERLLKEEDARILAPHALALHELAALLPEDRFAQGLRPVAVGDHPVFGRRKPCP